MNARKSIVAFFLAVTSFWGTSLRADDLCGEGGCQTVPVQPSCYSCPPSQDSSFCDRCCGEKRFGLSLPALKFSFSCPKIHCESDCCHSHSCCPSCCHKCKGCCVKRWWDHKEPPRVPFVSSIPAVTVPQQAVAITPVQYGVPVQAVQAPAPQRCQSPQLDETQLLLMLMLLKEREAAKAHSVQKAPASTTSEEEIRRLVREQLQK